MGIRVGLIVQVTLEPRPTALREGTAVAEDGGPGVCSVAGEGGRLQGGGRSVQASRALGLYSARGGTLREDTQSLT